MRDEIDLIPVHEGEWRALLQAAAELDLVRGGYFRARPGAIQFYCGPENAPEGWSFGFPDGSPELPRAAVGAAERSDDEDETGEAVRLTVSNWAAARAVKAAYDRGEYEGRYQRFVMDQEAALRGRPEERAWLRRQFEILRAHERGALVEERGPSRGE